MDIFTYKDEHVGVTFQLREPFLSLLEETTFLLRLSREENVLYHFWWDLCALILLYQSDQQHL